MHGNSISLWRKTPLWIRMIGMRRIFGIADNFRSKIRRTVTHNRLLLAARYIKGTGIEIGGLGRPLRVPSDARVLYVDRYSGEELARNYPNMEAKKIKILTPDIVAMVKLWKS